MSKQTIIAKKLKNKDAVDWRLLPACLLVSCILNNSAIAEEAKTTEKPEIDPRLAELFQSRMPIKDGKPDLTSISQCPLSSSMTRQERTLVTPENFSSKPAAGAVQMLADSVPVNSDELTHLKGNVSIRDRESLLRAQEIRINRLTGELSASGNVSLESQNAFFSAEELTRSDNNEQVNLAQTRFYIFANNANGTAESIRIEQEKNITFESLAFTTCPVGEETWQIKSDEMEVDTEEGFGKAYHTVIEIGDVPVFYLPYISFPIDNRRKSGVLMPSIKHSDDEGLDVAIPVYWNIAPNMDATITPRLIEKRGEQLDTEFRYLNEFGLSQVELEWMGSDQILADRLNNPNLNATLDADDDERWFGKIRNQSQFNSNWRADLNASRVSDSDYFRDFGSGIESSNAARLTSEFNLYYEDETWQMRWFALGHQSLIGIDYYRYLPSWTVYGDHLDDSGIRWQWSSEITQFDHSNQNQLEGKRYHVAPSVSWPVKASYGFLTPKLSYQISEYEQESQLTGEKTTVSRELPVFSFDSGLYFDRQFEWSKKSFNHSLEPRLFYTYIPFEDQSQINNFDSGQTDFSFAQLWRENRFHGIDRIGDTNRMSFALGNRFTALEDGRDAIYFQIGRSYYFEDREVLLSGTGLETNSKSPWLAQLDVEFSDALSFSGFIEWDEAENATNRAESRINFEPRENHIVNLTHRYRDLSGQKVEELDFSFAWSLDERWRLVGRWYNDLNSSDTIEALAGFEYESCCWAFRLVGQRYLNTQLDALGVPIPGQDSYNDGIYFQFVFKGLGAAGHSRLDQLLTTSINGYRDPFNRN